MLATTSGIPRLLSTLDPKTCVLIGALPVFAFVWWLSTRRSPRLPPGPGPILPVLGHLHLMEADMRGKFHQWRRQFGDVFSLYIGGRLVVVLCGFHTIKEALVKTGNAFNDRPSRMFVIDRVAEQRGVLSSSGKKWKEQRRASLEILRHLGLGHNQVALNIQEEVTHYVQVVRQHQGASVDLAALTQTSMANVICSLLFGKRFDYDDEEFLTCVHCISENVRLTGAAAFVNYFPWLESLPGDLFHVKKLLNNVDKLTAFIRSQTRRYYEKRKEHGGNPEACGCGCTAMDEGDNNGQDCFVQAYLNAMDQKRQSGEETTLDEANLEQFGMDLFVAGTETTSVTTSWALLLFIVNPDLQDKCFEEIQEVVGTERPPNMHDRPNLVYLEAFISELLRWASVVPVAVPHSCVASDVLFHDYVIPADTIVLPFLDSALNDPEVWDNPEEFRPERFIDEDGGLLRREELISFGMGRRNCLGEGLARTELFLYLSNLVQHFRFLPPEEEGRPSLTGIMGFTHSPKPYRIRAIPREQE